MTNLPSFQYFYKSGSKQLDVVLPGFDAGIKLPLMQEVIALSKEKGHSVLSFDYLFFERGDEKSSGMELPEERQTLEDLLNFVQAEQFDHICLIGKSLGGITASFFLRDLPDEEKKRYSLIILGCVKESVDLTAFPGRVVIVQGGADKHGDIEAVKNLYIGKTSAKVEYYGISGASHGFSDPETKEPKYYNQVIELLKKL
ncbi:MAG: alpha/beta family hydrolase [Patescibacteria group bacterium]|jgi:alpha/beta superfamily hydrolase